MRNVCVLLFVIAALAIVGCQKAGQIEIDEASEGIVDIAVEGEPPPEGTSPPESPGWDFAGGGWSDDGEEVAPDPEPEPLEPYELSGHGLVRLDGMAIASPLPVPVRVNVGMNFSRDLAGEEKAEIEAGFSLKDALGAALLGVFEWVDDNSLLFKLSRNLDYKSDYTYHVVEDNASFRTMVRGDINGDEVSDVIIGESGWNLDTGRAHVLNGINLAGGPIAVKEGEAVKDRFGQAVASAGDVNADGYADVIIGAPGFDLAAGPIWDAGKIYIYFGPTLDDANMITIEGTGKEEGFGHTVAGGGFIDDDGYADMAVGSPHYSPTSNPGDANKGRVYVISGANPSTPNSKVDGQLALESLGFSIAFAGDQVGNNLDDLVVGAPGFDSSRGRILLLNGANLDSPPLAEKRGEAGSAEQFGYSVASGNLNGDGRMDFIVGAPFHSSARGKIFLFNGSDTLTTDPPTFEWKGEFAGDRLGLSVASTADINGDEFDEVLMGAPNFNTTQGRIYLCRGPEPLPTCLARQGYVWDAGLGNSVARTGDLNGDGKDDIVVGASGANSYEGRYWILNVLNLGEVLGSGEGDNADNKLGCAVGGN